MVSRKDVIFGALTFCVTVLVLINVYDYNNCDEGDRHKLSIVRYMKDSEVINNRIVDVDDQVTTSTDEIVISTDAASSLKQDESTDEISSLAQDNTSLAQDDSSESQLVIIATESRSGSTWLGTLFQQIPSLLYVFEPLDARKAKAHGYASPETIGRQLSEDSALKVLSSLCTCRLDTIQPFGKAAHAGIMSDVTKYSIRTEFKQGKDHMEKFCRNFTTVMPKCIRLFDLSILKRLPEYGCQNYKVLHLVRDPRAVIRSRMVTFHELYSGNGKKTPVNDMTDEMILGAAKELCSNGIRNNLVGEELWLKEQYKLVLYRDIVADPHGKVAELYSYINENVTEKTTRFITKTTSGKNTASNYNVVKNSKAIAEKWRSLDPRKIELIESVCGDFFKRFGYDLFDGVVPETKR